MGVIGLSGGTTMRFDLASKALVNVNGIDIASRVMASYVLFITLVFLATLFFFHSVL